MLRRDLVLAVAELRVVLLQDDPLGIERAGELLDVALRRRRADRREAQAGVDRDEGSVHLRRKRELVFERRLEPGSALREPLLHPRQERPLGDGRRFAVQLHLVDEHRARARRVRQDAEGFRIGDEANLADGSHSLDRLQLVERVHGLHGHREPDPGPHPVGEPGHVGGLPSHHAAVVAVQEPDQADPVVAAERDDLLRRHRTSIPRRPAFVQPALAVVSSTGAAGVAFRARSDAR